jgi:hypothetical protein
VGFDSLFHVAGKVLVYDGIRAAGFERGNHRGDFAASCEWRLDHGDRTMILFD